MRLISVRVTAFLAALVPLSEILAPGAGAIRESVGAIHESPLHRLASQASPRTSSEQSRTGHPIKSSKADAGSSELFGRAKELLTEGSLEQARQTVEEGLALDAKSAPGYNLLGLIEGQEKDYARAEAAFEKARRLNSHSRPAPSNSSLSVRRSTSAAASRRRPTRLSSGRSSSSQIPPQHSTLSRRPTQSCTWTWKRPNCWSKRASSRPRTRTSFSWPR